MLRSLPYSVGTPTSNHGRICWLRLPQTTITEQQAAEIALAIKNVGHALAFRGIKPGYSQGHGETYRRYGISSYKNLARSKFEEVLTWLRSWYDELVGEAATDGQ